MPALPPIDPTSAAWLWDNIGKEFVAASGSKFFNLLLGKSKAFAEDEWQKFEWKSAAENYRKRMREQYNRVVLLGSSATVPLEGVFTDVYVLDKPSAERSANLLTLSIDPDKWENEMVRLDAVALVKNAENRCLMVLGKPGAGKTTFLKHLVLEATDNRINKIPVFITLKDWSDSPYGLTMEGLLKFIAVQFDKCGFPDAEEFIKFFLQKGIALVLLDGLDEINQRDDQDNELRNKAIQTIRDFVIKFNKTQCVMTCRVAANEYLFTDFRYAEVANFTHEQVNAFVGKWFKEDLRLREGFKTEINKTVNKGLRDLIKSPILLSLVCLAYQETHEFPAARRTEIYKQAVDALMRKWDVSRKIKRDLIYRGLSQGQKENLIAHVAAQTFDKGDYFVKKNNLAQFVEEFLKKISDSPTERGDGETVLRAVEAQHGIWVERAHDIYSFSHLSLQEYFTADYIMHYAGIGALQKLLTPEHISDARWREVILNTAGLLGDAGEFFSLFESSLRKLMMRETFTHSFFDWITKRTKSYPKGLVNPGFSAAMIELIGNSYYHPYVCAHEIEHNRIRDRQLAYANAQDLLKLVKSNDQIHGLNEEIGQAMKRVLGREPSTSSSYERDLDEAREKAHKLINRLNADIENDLKNVHQFDHAFSAQLNKCFHRNLDQIISLIFDVDLTYALAIARDLTRVRSIDSGLFDFLPPSFNDANSANNEVILDDVDIEYRLGLLGSVIANSIDTCAILESRMESYKIFKLLWDDLKKLVKTSRKNSDLGDFGQLTLPQPDSTQKEWRRFADKARVVINRQLDVGIKLNFSKENGGELINVLSATQLMLECLDVATVSPEVRQRVRDNILTIDE